MRGIVVGVDGSGHSIRALEWAVKEAVVRHAPLTVITVHPDIVSYFGGAVDNGEARAIAERVRKELLVEVNNSLATLGESPESVNVQDITGTAAAELVNASRDADLLVVGSRGAGGFGRLMMGAVSSQVAQHAHCPVVVIPPQDRG